jgi:cell division protein FtsW
MATRTMEVRAARAATIDAQAEARRSVRLTVGLLVPISLLVVVGLGGILSASSVVGLEESGDGLVYFKRQLVWMGIGVFGMLAAAMTPLRWWRRIALPAFVANLVVLAAVLFVGTRAYGSTRWIVLGPVSIQPSEVAKLTTVLFLAALMARHEEAILRFGQFLLPVGISVGAVGALVMLQPDLGTTVLIASGAFAVLTASAAPFSFVVSGGIMAGGFALLAARSSDYQWARVTAFLDLGADPLGNGYQAVQSLVALGTGGMFGVGLGASRARWFFLPNAHTDFVFSIIGEETGLAGSLTVVALFVVLTIAGTAVALRAHDRFGRLVAIGITTWLIAQALVNIGGVVGVLPITGVPLPFVSYGGSALLVEMIAVGVLLSVVRERAGSR